MTTIDHLGFSTRTYNCLKRARIDTVEQLARMSDENLLQIRSFGTGCLAEVREKVGTSKPTNADRIRAMSDEELSMVIVCPMEIIGSSFSNCTLETGCLACSLKWLKGIADG